MNGRDWLRRLAVIAINVVVAVDVFWLLKILPIRLFADYSAVNAANLPLGGILLTIAVVCHLAALRLQAGAGATEKAAASSGLRMVGLPMLLDDDYLPDHVWLLDPTAVLSGPLPPERDVRAPRRGDPDRITLAIGRPPTGQKGATA